jgi:hypothetical protein
MSAAPRSTASSIFPLGLARVGPPSPRRRFDGVPVRLSHPPMEPDTTPVPHRDGANPTPRPGNDDVPRRSWSSRAESFLTPHPAQPDGAYGHSGGAWPYRHSGGTRERAANQRNDDGPLGVTRTAMPAESRGSRRASVNRAPADPPVSWARNGGSTSQVFTHETGQNLTMTMPAGVSGPRRASGRS